MARKKSKHESDGSTPGRAPLERGGRTIACADPSWIEMNGRVARRVTTRQVTTAGLVAIAAAAVAGWLSYRAFTAHRVSQEADRLAEVLGLVPTSRAADIGAGDGAYTIELAARIVPRGHVFATEIDEAALEAIAERAADAGLDNVTTIRAGDTSTGLPAGCCDAVLLRGVYHHVSRPAETNTSLREALRAGGRLAIIDFEPSWFLSTFFPVSDAPHRGGHGVSPSAVIWQPLTLADEQAPAPGGLPTPFWTPISRWARQTAPA